MLVRELKLRQRGAAAFFLTPAYLLYAFIFLIPILATFAFSLNYIDRVTFRFEFVGLDNFAWIVTDGRFWTTFKNTLVFVVLAGIGNVGLGLVFALLLNRSLPAFVLYLFRLVFFLPVLVPISTIAFVWRFMYSTDFGLINYYLGTIGIRGIGWLTDADVAMASVLIFDIWKNFGFYMIIFLAALQGVPRDLIEAARIDGARRRSVFFKITLPIISPIVFFCVTYATITGLQVFDSVRVMTNGGPGDSTRVTVMYMVEEAFGAGDIGTGAAAALVLLFLIGLVTAVQFAVGRRTVQA